MSLRLIHSFWLSKLRYGIQLCTEVRIKDSDPQHANMKATQIAQNNLLRMIDGSKIKDKIRHFRIKMIVDWIR